MKSILSYFFLFLLLVPFGVYAQVLPEVGKLIKKSPTDLHYLTEGCTLAYSIKNEHLLCADSSGGGNGGGNIKTPRKATADDDFIEEEIFTAAGELSVVTTKMIPQGSVVWRCMARTTATVAGGYLLGTDGGEDAYGTLPGVLGEDNEDDNSFPANVPVYVDTPIQVTAPNGGTFADSTGKILITCFFKKFKAGT